MLLSRSELKDLSREHDGWHVSIYMPTHRAGDEILENAVRFKNLLDEAVEQLVESGLGLPEARELVAPARGLVDDEVFWQGQSDGLALFLSAGRARKYHLPLSFDDLVVVSDRFHIKPLMSVLSNNGRFYVLAVSQQEARLLQGTRHRIGEINLDDREQVPDSISEILKWEDPEMRLAHHPASESTLHQGVAAVFHGHGLASQDDPKEKILRYLHRLDAGISDLLADDDAPLVPAADDAVLALYREASNYPHLTEEGVAMQPERLSGTELHARAWSIVEPLFRGAEERARDAYGHLKGTESERASHDVAKIVPASVYGRVEGLFVAIDEQRWGTFDQDSGEVELHDEQEPGDRDLLSLAAVHTMLNEGWLFVLDAERVPDRGVTAAVLRW